MPLLIGALIISGVLLFGPSILSWDDKPDPIPTLLSPSPEKKKKKK